MAEVDQRNFRSALGQFATGVTIITALSDDSSPIGMTANSFASVSLEPPLVLWSVAQSSPLYSAFLAASHYAVHVLDDSQKSLSQRFSDDDVDKFADLKFFRGIHNLPLLNQHIALMQCKVIDRHLAGDHMILVGEVLDIQSGSNDPLVFFSGAYRRLQA